MRRSRVQQPVFVGLERVGPSRLRSGAILRDAGKRAWIDTRRARRRAARLAARARTGRVVPGDVGRIRNRVLLVGISGRQILATADSREIVRRARAGAVRRHGTESAATESA